MAYQIPEQGFVLNIDKPYGWSSFQVVNYFKWAIKRKTGLKKFKIGHAGTLDPLATGILLIAVGKMTKKIPDIQAGSKSYKGSMTLGFGTSSHDLEKPLKKVALSHLSGEELKQIANKLSGTYEQSAPVFSAKKVAGKRAYEHARKGKMDVELKKNLIEISKFDLDISKQPYFDFEVDCSKGTYIRSLVRDFGQLCQSEAVMTALRRTKSGGFLISQACAKPQWDQYLHDHLWDKV